MRFHSSNKYMYNQEDEAEFDTHIKWRNKNTYLLFSNDNDTFVIKKQLELQIFTSKIEN